MFSTPQLILSDNTQTFKRAEQDLQILLSNLDSPAIQRTLALKRIYCSYILACSLHCGDVYERLIGLPKTSLKKGLGRSLITLPELNTLIKEIQAILNDRPLTSINSDIHDLQPLTPNHLLFGFNALPHPSLDIVDFDSSLGDADMVSCTQQWHTLHYNHFLQRLQTEYLSLLRETHSYQNKKFHTSCNVIQVGDVVLVADSDPPIHRWELGIIQD